MWGQLKLKSREKRLAQYMKPFPPTPTHVAYGSLLSGTSGVGFTQEISTLREEGKGDDFYIAFWVDLLLSAQKRLTCEMSGLFLALHFHLQQQQQLPNPVLERRCYSFGRD